VPNDQTDILSMSLIYQLTPGRLGRKANTIYTLYQFWLFK